MTWSSLIPVLVAIIALLGSLWTGRRARRDRRDLLKCDLDILSAMPDDLPAKEEFREHVNEAASRLVRRERVADTRHQLLRKVRTGILAGVLGAVCIWVGIVAELYREREFPQQDTGWNPFSSETWSGFGSMEQWISTALSLAALAVILAGASAVGWGMVRAAESLRRLRDMA